MAPPTKQGFIQRAAIPPERADVLASALATEMPDPDKLDEATRAIYTTRQISKKGTDLNGVKVDGVDPIDAAAETIHYFMTPEHIDEVFARVTSGLERDSEETIHVTVPVKPDSSVNVLATGYATMLALRLNEKAQAEGYTNLHFSDEKTLVMTSTINRTFAGAVERLVKMPLFDVSAFSAGDKVILADDHMQSGGFFATAMNAFPEGVEVLGVASLTRHPLSASLALHPKVQSALSVLPNIDAVYAKLAEVGVAKDALTNREALTIIAAMSDGKDARVEREFEQLMDEVGRDPAIEAVEKSNDSLQALLQEEPMTARQLTERMEAAIPAERKGKGAP